MYNQTRRAPGLMNPYQLLHWKLIEMTVTANEQIVPKTEEEVEQKKNPIPEETEETKHMT